MVALAATFMFGIAVLYLIGPETLWPVALVQYVPFALLVPGLVAVACAWKLGWIWRLASFGLLALALTFFMGLELHLGSDPPNRLRVMTYNVKEYLALKRADGTLSVAYEISRHDADVIVLQDAGGVSDTVEKSPPLRKLMFGDRQIYTFGQYVIASRFALKNCRSGDISYRNETHTYVRCVLVFQGREIDLFTAHFLTPREGLNAIRSEFLFGAREWKQNIADRMTQAQRLVQDMRASSRPIIVAGDLNAPMHSLVIRTLLKFGLQDAFSEAGNGFGYSYGHSSPSRISFMRIDHILFSSEFSAAKCFVGGDEGSTHRPVIADLTMQ